MGFIGKGYLHIFHQDKEYLDRPMNGNTGKVELTILGVSPNISFTLTILSYGGYKDIECRTTSAVWQPKMGP